MQCNLARDFAVETALETRPLLSQIVESVNEPKRYKLTLLAAREKIHLACVRLIESGWKDDPEPFMLALGDSLSFLDLCLIDSERSRHWLQLAVRALNQIVHVNFSA